MIVYHNVPQRTPEWFALRCGRLTGSCVADVFAKGKGSAEAVGKRDLRIRLALEDITGQAQDDGSGYVNAEMQRGITKEPDAVAAHEARSGVLVNPIGFVSWDDLPIGCSPDGLIGDDGVLEVKCPKTATHLRYLRDPAALATDYGYQALHALWVTGRQWVDLVSFDDRLPAKGQLVVVRIERSAATLDPYITTVMAFLADVDDEKSQLTQLLGAA